MRQLARLIPINRDFSFLSGQTSALQTKMKQSELIGIVVTSSQERYIFLDLYF